MVTQWYNQLHSTILAVELGLVKEEIEGMNHQLKPALQELTWAQEDLWDYIQSTQDLVKVPDMHCIAEGHCSVARHH